MTDDESSAAEGSLTGEIAEGQEHPGKEQSTDDRLVCPRCGAQDPGDQPAACPQCGRETSWASPSDLTDPGPTCGRCDHPRSQHGSPIDGEAECVACREIYESYVGTPDGPGPAEHKHTFLEKGRAFNLGRNRQGVAREDGLYVVERPGAENQSEYKVARAVTVDAVIEVENTPHDVQLIHATYRRPFLGTYEDMRRQLRGDGFLYDDGLAHRILARMVEACPDRRRGLPAWEVQEGDDGRLDIPDRVWPLTEEQARIDHDLIDPAEVRKGPEIWTHWSQLHCEFDYEEIAPLMGLTAMAPLAPTYRRRHRIFPALFLVSSSHGTGKTSAAKTHTADLWGLEGQTGDAGSSRFRLLNNLDAGAVLLLFDEAQDFPFDRQADQLKAALGQIQAGARGRQDLTMRRYASRATPIFTANHLPRLPRPLLVRFIISHFREDRQEALDQEAADAFENRVQRLQPVGWELVRAILQRYPTADDLLAETDRLASLIRQHVSGTDLQLDTRRGGIWAVVLLGLQAWDDAGGNANLPAPTVGEFVEQVVVPTERKAAERAAEPGEALWSWWGRWRIDNQPKGEGDNWREGRVDQGDLVLAGHFVDRRVLGWYNKDTLDTHQEISTLKDACREIGRTFGIPLDWFTIDDGQAPVRHIGGSTRRVVFIPDDEPEEVRRKVRAHRDTGGGDE